MNEDTNIMAEEQCGTEEFCKNSTTGSIPAFASNFIDVICRDDPQEMSNLMGSYYDKYFRPNNAAHDMLRLGLSIVWKYNELKEKYIALSKENSRLKRSPKI